jgi:hypothetical protein
MPHPRRAVTGCLLVLVIASAVGVARANPPDGTLVAVSPAPAPSAAVAPPPSPPRALPAPRHLPKIVYSRTPKGFPADPAPGSVTAITEGLHPERKLAVYDAPGGRPRAFLPRSISGLTVVVPIVARQPGWVAVLLPSANRRIGWLPDTGWSPRPLRDQLVLRRRTHELTWLRDGRPRETWRVSVGAKSTPTPLGRTFVLGRTGTRGSVYAGLDALVLGAVPENRGALAAGLRDAHTGIHGWIRTSAFGRSVSNGCIRMPPAAQRTLLHHVGPGTTVHVVD